MVLLRHKWSRWGTQSRGDETGSVLGEFRHEIAHDLECLRAVIETPEQQCHIDHWADLVEAEFEGRDNPEIAPATANRPKKLAVFSCGHTEYLRIGGHYLRSYEIVATQSTELGQPPDSAAEGEACDAGVTDEPARHG